MSPFLALTLPEPLVLQANIDLVVEEVVVDLKDLLPNWSEMLQKEEKTPGLVTTGSTVFLEKDRIGEPSPDE